MYCWWFCYFHWSVPYIAYSNMLSDECFSLFFIFIFCPYLCLGYLKLYFFFVLEHVIINADINNDFLKYFKCERSSSLFAHLYLELLINAKWTMYILALGGLIAKCTITYMKFVSICYTRNMHYQMFYFTWSILLAIVFLLSFIDATWHAHHHSLFCQALIDTSDHEIYLSLASGYSEKFGRGKGSVGTELLGDRAKTILEEVRHLALYTRFQCLQHIGTHLCYFFLSLKTHL